MADIVYEQFRVFLHSFLCGFFLWTIYDLLLLARKTWRHGVLLTALGDITFWLVAAGIIFSMLYTYNYGALRGYAVFGVVLGILLHGCCVTRPVLYLYGCLQKAIRCRMRSIFKNMSKK